MAPTKKRSPASTSDLLHALRHPLRRRILHTLSKGEPRSPRQLAELLDQPLSNLSYHVRVLADCGAVKLVRTRQVRGSTQHFYRTSIKADWAQSMLKSTDRPKKRGRRTGKEKS
jgi:DNA-binding transcriptional ArsR family regulator